MLLEQEVSTIRGITKESRTRMESIGKCGSFSQSNTSRSLTVLNNRRRGAIEVWVRHKPSNAASDSVLQDKANANKADCVSFAGFAQLLVYVVGVPEPDGKSRECTMRTTISSMQRRSCMIVQ